MAARGGARPDPIEISGPPPVPPVANPWRSTVWVTGWTVFWMGPVVGILLLWAAEATLTVLAPAAGAAFYVWVRGLGYGWAAWLLGAPVTAAGCLLWFRRRRRLEREAAAADEYGDPALPQNIGEAARQARRRRELGEG